MTLRAIIVALALAAGLLAGPRRFPERAPAAPAPAPAAAASGPSAPGLSAPASASASAAGQTPAAASAAPRVPDPGAAGPLSPPALSPLALAPGTPAPPAPPEDPAGGPLLLGICYHRFGPESADPYCISLERLESELQWLRQEGWAPVSLSQVAAALQGLPGALPPKGVLLSVDDGYRSGAWSAPLFERYGYRGVYFVNPASLGRGAFLRWDELRDLERRGHAVASHSLSHPNLAKVQKPREPRAYAAWAERELGLSKALLERELGHPVEALAWPYGAYNPALVAAAQRLGYRQLWTVSGGVNAGGLDGLRLRRIIIMGHPGPASFRRHCQSLPVRARLEGLEEGSLLYRSQLPRAVKVRGRVQAGLGGLPLDLGPDGSASLDSSLASGFHYLTLDQRSPGGLRRTPFLFQLAPDAWRPAFEALAQGAPAGSALGAAPAAALPARP